MGKLTALLLLVSAGLAIVIVLYATLDYYRTSESAAGRYVSLFVALFGVAALASLTISTFRHFLQPVLENGSARLRPRSRRRRKRNP